MRRIAGLACAMASVLAGAAGVAIAIRSSPAAAEAPKAAAQPFTVAVRRLTESQYRNIVAEVFGPGLALNARFEPELREQGLQAIGNAQLSVTSSGFEQYFSLADQVAGQAVDPKRRAQLACQPANPKAADEACTRAIVSDVGGRLFRRPLTAAEVSSRVRMATNGAARTQDYYAGLRLALASLLVDPEFLFRVETAEPDPARPGQYRLSAYTKASRLSFLLWDAAPDAELAKAAASGEIHKDAVLKAQAARLLASPRVRDGARAFFIDMLQFENFDSLTKDGVTYPKYSQKVADSAREQTLRTLVDQLVDRDGDYRDVFTSNQTFINRALAAVYKAPYRSKQDWMAYTFPEQSERSGILTQVTFLSLFSHPAASSPTKRGVKIHEIFLCQKIPDPPPNVDFSKVQATDKGTVRTRLLDHMENPGCASCHKVSDPSGLALEHFDGLGQLRTLENGAPIDVSAEMRGRRIEGAQGLGRALHDDPRAASCLVRNVYAYGVGRAPEDADEDYLKAQSAAFAADGYRFKELLSRIATSPGFLRVEAPKPAVPTKSRKIAALQPHSQGALR